MATTISVSRDSGYADRRRDYRVVLDGAEIGRIGDGGQTSFDITSGRHQLMLKIDWCRSNIVVFDLAEGQSAEFKCGSSLRGWRQALLLYYAIFGFRNYLWLHAI
jgi:hypothetical protein